MGSLTPTISQGLNIAGALSGLTGGLPGLSTAAQLFSVYDKTSQSSVKAEQELALKQLQQQQALQQAQLAANTNAEKQKIAADAAQAEEERKAALRRAVAKQRASFGSQGIGSSSGSSEAVLLGLFDESEDERKKREELDALKTAALDDKISQNQSLNLLQQQQLQEKQKLARIF
jgi:hypothetical protein